MGKIEADRIVAKNVVSGIQVQGLDIPVAEIVRITAGLRGGDITAGSIEATNVVAGLQVLAPDRENTLDDLRREIAELRSQLERAIAEGDLDDDDDARDARAALETAEMEAGSVSPNRGRTVRKLREATDILTAGLETAAAAGKVGRLLAKLAPAAAATWQVAQGMLAG